MRLLTVGGDLVAVGSNRPSSRARSSLAILSINKAPNDISSERSFDFEEDRLIKYAA